MTDGELLGDFARTRSETAFAELVRRHGPMVHGVCLHVTRRAELAEDAAQAAFLVLARKAASVAGEPDAGGWLHRVAADLARDALRAEARRRVHEKEAVAMRSQEPSPTAQPAIGVLLGAVHAELARLPAGQRQVVVGLHLEGRTRSDLAKTLGVPEGTVAWRSKVAIEKLRERLARRGVSLGTGALVAALAGTAAAAELPASLASLPSLAVAFAAEGAAGAAGIVGAAGAQHAAPLQLAEGAVRAMFWTKMKALASIVAVAAAMSVALSATYRAITAGEPAKSQRPIAVEPQPGPGQPEPRKLVAPPSKPETANAQEAQVTVELSPAEQQIEAGSFPSFKVTFKREGKPAYAYLGLYQLEMGLLMTDQAGKEYRYWAGPKTEFGVRHHLNLFHQDSAVRYIEYTCRRFVPGSLPKSGIVLPGTGAARPAPELPAGNYKAKLILHVERPVTAEELAKAAAGMMIPPAEPAPRDMLVPEGRTPEDYFVGKLTSNEVTVTVGK